MAVRAACEKQSVKQETSIFCRIKPSQREVRCDMRRAATLRQHHCLNPLRDVCCFTFDAALLRMLKGRSTAFYIQHPEGIGATLLCAACCWKFCKGCQQSAELFTKKKKHDGGCWRWNKIALRTYSWPPSVLKTNVCGAKRLAKKTRWRLKLLCWRALQ